MQSSKRREWRRVHFLLAVCALSACSTTTQSLSAPRTPSLSLPSDSSAAEPAEPAERDAPLDLTEPLMVNDTALASVGPASMAEPYSNLYRRGSISLGLAAYSNFDTTMRVDSDTLVGAVIDLEDTFGVDDSSSVARLDAYYSFSPRHRVDFSVYDLSRDGSRVTTQDINFGDVTIPAGSGVETNFDTTIIKLDYRYNFVTDERTVIGVSGGFHTMGFDIGMETANNAISESFRTTLPLPLLGIHGEYALSRKWRMLADLQVLRLEIGEFAGYISDQRFAIEHDTWKNFGWGIGTNAFTLDAEMEKGHLTADVEYAFQGVMLYARASF